VPRCEPTAAQRASHQVDPAPASGVRRSVPLPHELGRSGLGTRAATAPSPSPPILLHSPVPTPVQTPTPRLHCSCRAPRSNALRCRRHGARRFQLRLRYPLISPPLFRSDRTGLLPRVYLDRAIGTPIGHASGSSPARFYSSGCACGASSLLTAVAGCSDCLRVCVSSSTVLEVDEFAVVSFLGPM
jgi:hypothetical protein